MKYFLFFFFFSLCTLSQASVQIQYKLSMPKPQNHYYVIEMNLNGFKEKELTIKMPVWAPGSYLVREFAKNVDLVKAFDEQGKPLKVTKTSKNGWKIQKGEAKNVRVVYEVYAFELSVRTSFLDMTHGFVSGSGVFMYIEKYKDLPGRLEVIPHASFQTVSTALAPSPESVASDGSFCYDYENYDELVDCPIEIGNQEVFSFTAAGVKHEVAMNGVGNYSVESLQKDMAKVVETATNVIGENPNKRYVFIVHNVVDGQGGLEHASSCVLSVNRWTYEGTEYKDFLSLVAHEYFHLWNVKRIRPIELGPFDYDQENYTTLLWVMEGFTSYYDELLLRRAGYHTQEAYLSKIQNTINYVEGSIGSRVQPVAHASFDAWIKAYRPNENSGNTTMTYYSRGQMIAALFDAMIIASTKGQKCLDHLLQQLYFKYYKGLKRGFTEQEFQKELEILLGKNMDTFFEKYIHGVEITPLDEVFGAIGMNVETVMQTKPNFGASFKQEAGKLLVRSIRANSAAENAGLSVNDEIIGCNGFRVDQNAFESFVNSLETGLEFNVLVARNELLFELTAKMTDYTKPQFLFKLSTDPEKVKLRNYWLRSVQ
jgi:predicted metalloprotease with PDZ domain